jgi:hypothetical protein
VGTMRVGSNPDVCTMNYLAHIKFMKNEERGSPTLHG